MLDVIYSTDHDLLQFLLTALDEGLQIFFWSYLVQQLGLLCPHFLLLQLVPRRFVPFAFPTSSVKKCYSLPTRAGKEQISGEKGNAKGRWVLLGPLVFLSLGDIHTASPWSEKAGSQPSCNTNTK